jgi:hypothetical protein
LRTALHTFHSVRPEFIEGLLESKERFDGLNANGNEKEEE